MINIGLILLLIHYVLFFAFKDKRDKNVLGCGIFAWSGLKPGQFNKDKFNILGIMNETRGEHSCGVTSNGKIQVGVNGLKVYRDFASVEDLLIPQEVPAIIGHTRHSTVGAHTADNAHPFGFGEIDGAYSFVGVHNGTLLNHEVLAEEYGIDLYEGEGKKKRKKIDSELLLEILYNTRDFDVLSKYNGAAALKWQYLEEPDVVYYYHGKSKLYPVSQATSEERPLFYFMEGKNSLYTSSIEDSLYVIGGTIETVFEFEHNTVYKVTNGDIANAEKFPIDRTGRFQKRSTSQYNYTGYGTGASRDNAYDYGNYGYPKTAEEDTEESKALVASTSKAENIYNEVAPYSLEELGGKIFFNKLRYWRNHRRITGHYTWIKGHGFYFLHRDTHQATEIFYSYVNKYFYNNGFYSPKDLPKGAEKEAFIPFKHGGASKEITNPPIFHFYDGIMMEHGLDVQLCIDRAAVGREFSIQDLSVMALHPIMDISYVTRPVAFQQIYKDKKLFTGTITPLESDRIYVINVGNLVATKDITVPRLNPPTALSIMRKVEKEAEDTEKEEIKDSTPKVDEDLLDDEITKMFSFAYTNFPNYKRQLLDKYGDSNRKVKQAVSIIDSFTAKTYKLLTVEPKEN